jgi:hypothetical protein
MRRLRRAAHSGSKRQRHVLFDHVYRKAAADALHAGHLQQVLEREPPLLDQIGDDDLQEEIVIAERDVTGNDLRLLDSSRIVACCCKRSSLTLVATDCPLWKPDVSISEPMLIPWGQNGDGRCDEVSSD